MHDPMTVAHELKWPWKNRYGMRDSWLTIWHVDPEKDGTDDSCGWFIRARHCDQDVLAKVVKAFDFDWDRVFVSDSKNTYYTGLFYPTDQYEGAPRLSPIAITLCLYRLAAHVVFNSNWRKTNRFMQKYLHDIVMFAENPFDSLHPAITQQFGKDGNRDERIAHFASIIYSDIMRKLRPWWEHPRWHIHHWSIQWHFWQKLRRFLFERCAKCGKRYHWGYCPIGNWEHTKTWHIQCDDSAKVASK